MKIIMAAGAFIVIGLGWWYTTASDSMPTAPVADIAKKMDVTSPAAGESMQGKPAADKMMDTPSAEQPMAKETMVKEAMPTPSAGMMGGQYVAYAPDKFAFAEEGKVVLFFRASWCPSCKALDADIRANLSAIPKDVLILDVNYDTEKALKTKYGVTTQHTLVQVDASGNRLALWNGNPTLKELLSEVK